MLVSRSRRGLRRCSVPLRAAAVLLALALAGCEGELAATSEIVRPVRTQVLVPTVVDVVGVFPGEIRPHRESRLGFQVNGKLVERNVQLGDSVQQGQVLARLDPQDLGLAESAARAELAAAEADRIRTSADLARYTKLFEAGFISKAEFDQRRAAQAAAEARSAQARAGLQVRTNQAEYAVLRADADGLVTGVDAEVGQVVAAGQPVVRVASGTESEVAIQIPEGRLDAVRAIGRATVSLWAAGPELQGELTEIAASADPATRAFAARVRLRDTPESVRYGMTATVSFSRALAQPMAQVPLSALLRQGEGTAVWVVDPHTLAVRKHPVQVATVTDTEVILAPGLPAGAEVVTAGVHLLTEGQRVKRLNGDADAPTVPPAPATAAMLPLSGGLNRTAAE